MGTTGSAAPADRYPLSVEMTLRAVEECGFLGLRVPYHEVLVRLGQKRTGDYNVLQALGNGQPDNDSG